MGQGSRTLRLIRLTAALCAGSLVTSPGLAAGADSGVEWSFVSAPNLHPPKLQVLVRKPGLAHGDFLTTNLPGPAPAGQVAGQFGPLILDSRARPVWFMPLRHAQAWGLQQETYRGEHVLVFFEAVFRALRRGAPPRPYSDPGRVVIYDEHYRKIATVKARSPWITDLHDASIVGGDIWITVTRPVNHQDLTAYGGPSNATVLDDGLQEFQISTGRLLRTWDALNPAGRPNVPLSASYQRASAGWDPYHLNSVQALPDGDLLVSMRNTSAVYLIDPARNRIIWRLGGRRSSFRLARQGRFAWQHDAQLVHPGQDGKGRSVELTLFDDNTGRGPARGMILSLDTITDRARLVAGYPHHPAYYAQLLGSMQLLPNGNTLVGWGSPYAYLTEFSRSGRELLNVAWPGTGEQSYRDLFSADWVGRPYYPPRGALRGNIVYASWNGATEVSRWEVLAGSSTSALRVAASARRTGFETAIGLGRSHDTYEVRALDAHGHVLGTSRPFS